MFLAFISILSVCVNPVLAQTDCVKVSKIWDNGMHNAFTSIIKYKGKYYCAFREGFSHIFDNEGNAEGKIRILSSEDGNTWTPTALIAKAKYDLRDSQLSITPDGRLMVLMGGSVYVDRKLTNMLPQVSFSEDGVHYSKPSPIQLDEKVKDGRDWLWKLVWSDGIGYGVNYNRSGISLVTTKDGISYDLIKTFDISGSPNETCVRILSDKRMALLVRRESGDQKGYWGISNPPYTDWEWKALDIRLGGPEFIELKNELIVAGTRSHFIPSAPKTILLTGSAKGLFQEKYVLPSGKDTSYTGLLVDGDELWVSYYSTHETTKSAIYLARFPLSFFE